MLKLVSNHSKTKAMCKNEVKKFTFVIVYVSNQFKTQEIYDKINLENGGMSRFIPNCYKNQRMCDKAIVNYFTPLKFVPDCYKTRNMSDKAVDTYPSAMQFASDGYKTQEMCNKPFAFLYLILFPVNIKLKKCAIKLLIFAVLYLIQSCSIKDSRNVR